MTVVRVSMWRADRARSLSTSSQPAPWDHVALLHRQSAPANGWRALPAPDPRWSQKATAAVAGPEPPESVQPALRPGLREYQILSSASKRCRRLLRKGRGLPAWPPANP